MLPLLPVALSDLTFPREIHAETGLVECFNKYCANNGWTNAKLPRFVGYYILCGKPTAYFQCYLGIHFLRKTEAFDHLRRMVEMASNRPLFRPLGGQARNTFNSSHVIIYDFVTRATWIQAKEQARFFFENQATFG